MFGTKLEFGGVTPDELTAAEQLWVQTNALLGNLSDKQATLVSGTNIKTINSTSLLGSGNIDIAGGTDEKVKFDAGDSTAGYVADKIVAGTGISVAEGAGANENKLVITNTFDTLAELTEDTTHRVVTDAEKTTWNSKAAGDHNHTGVYEPADANIQTHLSSTSNPHGVTLEQARAANQTLSGQLDIANDVSVYFGGPEGGNGNSFKTGSDGNFLFDVGGNNSVKIKGGDSAGTEGLSYTNGSWTDVWRVNTVGDVSQAGDMNIATGKKYKINGSDLTYSDVGAAAALGTDDNYVTDAEKVKLSNLSGTNTGDQTLPVKASGAELDTGTDDAKFATAKALKDSGYLSSMADVTAASDTVAGKVELATTAETDTGTDTGRAVTPDGLSGSIYGKKIVQVKVFDDATALATGDGKAIFCIPPELNGMNLVDADAFVTTVSSSGNPTVMIRNVTDSADMLSTAITIDASEFTSYTAATAPVINTATDDVVTGDRIAIDVDGAGTGAKGLGVILTFMTP